VVQDPVQDGRGDHQVPKISCHWEKFRFEVRISAPFLYLLELS
jgi:hypothetical protein